MKTLSNIFAWSIKYLSEKGVEAPKRQAEDLISALLNYNRFDIYQHMSRALSNEEWHLLEEGIIRRGRGEPYQYIVGYVEFFDCRFQVTQDTLIPRQETEILVDIIAKELADEKSLKGKVFWDICCGSGCIGISLKKRFSDLQVFCSDISQAALAVAQRNAEINQVEIQFVQGDLLSPFAGQYADFLCCNPPYISESEFADLEKEVKLYEPKQALVSGDTGLELYECITKQLPLHLRIPSKVWFEIGYLQGPSVQSILQKHFPNNSVSILKDWSSKDRFIYLENK